MSRLLVTLFLLCATAGSIMAEPILAPNLQGRALSQLSAHSSACGPVSLMNAFRLGSPKWQAFEQRIQGNSDKARIYQLINTYGSRPSIKALNQPRWQTTTGMNPADLTLTANELTTGLFTPKIKLNTLILREDETTEQLLARAYKHFAKSLKKGLPPILGVTRYIKTTQRDGTITWQPIKAHYIVLTQLNEITTDHSSMNVSYVDPWGAKTLQGSIDFTKQTFFQLGELKLPFPQLTATLPDSGVGRQRVKASQQSLILLTSAIGAF